MDTEIKPDALDFTNPATTDESTNTGVQQDVMSLDTNIETPTSTAQPPTPTSPATNEIDDSPDHSADTKNANSKQEADNIQVESPQTPPTQTTGMPVDNTNISVGICFLDLAGLPIDGLKYKLTIGGTAYHSATNILGAGDVINNIEPNLPLILQIRKDNDEFVTKYEGYTAYQDMNICAVSPYIKIPVSTEAHIGSPNTVPPRPIAPQPSTKTIYPQAGEIKKIHSPTKIQMVKQRNADGHPMMSVKEQLVDWAGRHQIPTFGLWHWQDFKEKHLFQPAPKIKVKRIPATTSPATKYATPAKGVDKGALKVSDTEQAAPEQVARLMRNMEEQVTWQWKTMMEGSPRRNTANVLSGLKDGSLKPDDDKTVSTTNGRCYPSVKVGLTRSDITKAPWSDIPAKGAGAWLKSEGFADITADIPDARWSMPGDVIVYRYTDTKEAANIKKHAEALAAYEEKRATYEDEMQAFPDKKQAWEADRDNYNKEQAALKQDHPKHKIHAYAVKAPHAPKPLKTPPDDGNYGHIEVRTYDGYMSDFKIEFLADASKFVVMGIYRKVFDPLPDLRVRAFLKVLREWECHEESDDSKRYFMMYKAINGSRRFTDTSTHPFEAEGDRSQTPAGAYQIVFKTYKYNTGANSGIESGFSAALQDRLAVRIIEGRGALGHIRKGEITEAISILRFEWSSLPGGQDARHKKQGETTYVFTIKDLTNRFNIFMSELSGK